MSQKPVIRIFHNMARSGGTLVSKCIGSMHHVRLLSEIHPDANHVPYLNVVDQAHRWYDLVAEQTVAAKPDFLDGVSRVHAACENQGLKLVLRDWATIDFIGKLLIDEPVYHSRINEALSAHFDIREVALTRHPLDQWLSTSRLKIYTGKLSAEEFFRGYRIYAEQMVDHFVRYEDFTRDPNEGMQLICNHLELDYDPGFSERWHLNTCITGDNKKSSRGSAGEEANQIRPMPRRAVPADLQKLLDRNHDYQDTLDLLDYPL